MESVSLSARIRIARVDGRVFEAVRATVRESRRLDCGDVAFCRRT